MFEWCVVMLAACQIADGLLTMRAVNRGVEEANPLMAVLLTQPESFLTGKFSLGMCSFLLIAGSDRLWVRLSTIVCAIVYMCVVLWHFCFL